MPQRRCWRAGTPLRLAQAAEIHDERGHRTMFIRVHGTGGSAPETRADKRRRMVREETTPFIIGTEARCSDRVCGEVIRVVVDPVAQTVTHLVVEPKERRGPVRHARPRRRDTVPARKQELRGIRSRAGEFLALLRPCWRRRGERDGYRRPMPLPPAIP